MIMGLYHTIEWMCNANTEFTFPVRFTQTEQEVATVLYVL